MKRILELAGLHLEGEREGGFRWECGGGGVGVEACGDWLRPDGGIAEVSHTKTRRREGFLDRMLGEEGVDFLEGGG
jgi:hypothetical protein